MLQPLRAQFPLCLTIFPQKEFVYIAFRGFLKPCQAALFFLDNLPKVFADPLLEKAVHNLIENSLRHGECITYIKVTFSVENNDNGVLIFEDDGVGVPDDDKERIFDLSFGKNTGLGLFLIREILGLTDMKIHERGQFGHGARFEITIPPGYWKW